MPIFQSRNGYFSLRLITNLAPTRVIKRKANPEGEMDLFSIPSLSMRNHPLNEASFIEIIILLRTTL